MDTTQSLGHNLANTGRKVTQHLTQLFEQYGITSEQWYVLHRLTERDGITQLELSKRTEKDPTNITRILDQLSRKGWIERKANALDRRSYLLYVTPSGVTLSQLLSPIEKQFTDKLAALLTPEQLDNLKLSLRMINQYLNSTK
ncbi:MarR family transcriptional regulator [Paenibacillus turicensis]|uniref:MarR family winged helix-turn-helix transcriptional regulator n=1 Tax=Paenibacillus turicensis TaxID=160487 RepID=UPI003D280EC1